MNLPKFINPEVNLSKPTRLNFSIIQVEEVLSDLSKSAFFVKYVSPIDRREQLRHELKTERVFLDHYLNSIDKVFDSEGYEILNKCIPKITMFHTLLKITGCVEAIRRTLHARPERRIMVVCSYSDATILLIEKLKQLKISTVKAYDGMTRAWILKNIKLHADCKKDVLIIKPEMLSSCIRAPHVDDIIFLTTSFDVVDNTQAIMRCYSFSEKERILVRVVSLHNNPIDNRICRLLLKHIVRFFKSIGSNVARKDRYYWRDK